MAPYFFFLSFVIKWEGLLLSSTNRQEDISDCQLINKTRDKDIVEFVHRPSDVNLEAISRQVDRAVFYVQTAY